MARTGDVLENPVTGERITFLETAGETNGQLLRFEFGAPPHNSCPPEQMHPLQEERIELVAGTVRLQVGHEERVLIAGDSLIIPAGTRHCYRNDGGEEGRMLIELRPALKTEVMLETLFGLARDGKMDRQGFLGLLQTVAISEEYRDESGSTLLPPPLQRAAVTLLAPLSRRVGYRGRYPSYSDSR